MSFHQREGCLRGNCILITRSNGPPAIKCTFICLFVLKWICLIHYLTSFKFNDVISSYSEFLCTSDSVYHVFVSYLYFDVFRISSSLPKIQFMLSFQCQIIFCSCYNLDIIISTGQHDPKASIIFRGKSVLCFC